MEEIYFLLADQKYVELHTFDHKYLLTSSLSALEKKLPKNFARIHRSAMINVNYLEEAVKMSNSLYEVRMKDKNKTKLAVSRKLKGNLGL